MEISPWGTAGAYVTRADALADSGAGVTASSSPVTWSEPGAERGGRVRRGARGPTRAASPRATGIQLTRVNRAISVETGCIEITAAPVSPAMDRARATPGRIDQNRPTAANR